MEQWRCLVSELIAVCYRMSDVVSPVVQSSSPEGLIPMDSDSGNLCPQWASCKTTHTLLCGVFPCQIHYMPFNCASFLHIACLNLMNATCSDVIINIINQILIWLFNVCVFGQRRQPVCRGSCRRFSPGTPMTSSQVPESWTRTPEMMTPRPEPHTHRHWTQVRVVLYLWIQLVSHYRGVQY